MIKVVTDSFVFKFTGGAGEGHTRQCYYCRRFSEQPHVTVYPNCGHGSEVFCLFVCESCIKQGLKESREGWERFRADAKKGESGEHRQAKIIDPKSDFKTEIPLTPQLQEQAKNRARRGCVSCLGEGILKDAQGHFAFCDCLGL